LTRRCRYRCHRRAAARLPDAAAIVAVAKPLPVAKTLPVAETRLVVVSPSATPIVAAAAPLRCRCRSAAAIVAIDAPLPVSPTLPLSSPSPSRCLSPRRCRYRRRQRDHIWYLHSTVNTSVIAAMSGSADGAG